MLCGTRALRATSNGWDYIRWDNTRANVIRSHFGLGSGGVGRRRLVVGIFGLADLWAQGGDNVIVNMVEKAYSM